MEYGVFAFFSILGMYNYHRISKSKELVNEDLRFWYNQNRNNVFVLTVFSFISALIIVQLLIKDYQVVLSLFVPVLIASIWYVVPLFEKRLRDIPFLKSPVVAISWMIVLIAFPLLNEYNLTVNNCLQLVGFFAYFLALTIPFDIRDQKIDATNQRSLPQLFGNQFSKAIAFVFLLVFYFIFAIFYDNLRFNVVFIVCLLLTSCLILVANDKRSYLFFATVDLSMLLLSLCFFYN